MPKKQNSDVVEINVPKFVIPVAILLVGLGIFLIFSSRGDDVKNGDEKKDEVTFSEPGIVEASVEIDVDEGAYVGDLETAKYAIVEFSDYQCGFCSRHASETLPEIKENMLDYELVYFFREVSLYPPQSMTLSLLGQCIFENEGIENYLDYHNQAYDFSFEEDAELLEKVEVSSEVKECFNNREYEERIENNWLLTQGTGIQGVPGFVFGKLNEGGAIEGFVIPGAYPYEIFEEIFDVLKK